MENQNENIGEPIPPCCHEKSKNSAGKIISVAALIIFAFIASYAYTKNSFSGGAGSASLASALGNNDADSLEEAVIPSGGVEIPIAWGDLGKKMIAASVIDESSFSELYADRGGMNETVSSLLTGDDNGTFVITPDNSGQILNLFWAFGLSNRNPVLENGPMKDPEYGGADQFASTAGWTLAVGDPMEHYSAHAFVRLTPAEQALVERVAKNIYRPCCGNSTYFPDCNHGMAMLGLLELMAAKGADEAAMYRAALQVNSYWFPDTYLVIGKYLERKGISWNAVDPKEVLGFRFSSASGYRRIVSEMAAPVEGGKSRKSSGGCGV